MLENTILLSLIFYLFISPFNRIRYLLLARLLRLVRILMHVQRYRAFIATFLTLIPSLMPYLGIIFCVLCMYCSLGVQVIYTVLLTSWLLFQISFFYNRKGKYIDNVKYWLTFHMLTEREVSYCPIFMSIFLWGEIIYLFLFLFFHFGE